VPGLILVLSILSLFKSSAGKVNMMCHFIYRYGAGSFLCRNIFSKRYSFHQILLYHGHCLIPFELYERFKTGSKQWPSDLHHWQVEITLPDLASVITIICWLQTLNTSAQTLSKRKRRPSPGAIGHTVSFMFKNGLINRNAALVFEIDIDCTSAIRDRKLRFPHLTE